MKYEFPDLPFVAIMCLGLPRFRSYYCPVKNCHMVFGSRKGALVGSKVKLFTSLPVRERWCERGGR